MVSRNLTIFAVLLSVNLLPSLRVARATPGSPDLLGGVEVVNYPAPAGEKLSADYTLRVSGLAVPVYECRVSAMPFNQVWPGYQRSVDQTELAGFAYWDMSGAVRVEVTVQHPFQSVAIRPTSRGIQPTIEGQRITFQVSRPSQFTLELDGPHHALHLFANPPEVEVPKAGDPSVLYFGPGVHHPGKIQLQNGQTVYVAGGAVVYATVEGRGISGVRILGRGIIDSSEFARGQFGGSIHLSESSDVKIDGVILRDPPEWCLSAFGCRNLAISDVKLIGLWRYNSDGIDICNSQDVTIRDSFVRSFDDSIVLKGIRWKKEAYDQLPERNIRVTNLVVWCDWGRALEIGAETSAPEYSDIIFRDIDIIRNTHIAMDIQHGDRAAVHNIRYENIRVEVDDVNPPPLIQNQPGEKYNAAASMPVGACGGCATLPANAKYLPNLLVIVVAPNGASVDGQAGTVREVIFKDIFVTGKTMPPSAFTGFDPAHDVRGVTIENLRFNGHPIASTSEAHLQIGKYVQDVRVLPGGAGR